ncbi:hypothetical protein [Paraburkholderia sp. UYCP14C]|uniref:hypothetical protein n=1 Tax=Paraburkholderia sp. UYCP14C TaxID=2511130 RepID=UPI0027D2FE01|nr:hypothetical protein [Paraburkholderia sp. UYCP14C]
MDQIAVVIKDDSACPDVAARQLSGQKQVDISETRHAEPSRVRHAYAGQVLPDDIDLDRAELDKLLERQLIALEGRASGVRRPRLTLDGESLLRATAGKH